MLFLSMGESESPRQAQYAIESGPGEGATFTVEQGRAYLFFYIFNKCTDQKT